MFQVKETELAIKFRLREIVAADFEPGLHFMIPWINTVQKFDRRVLTRNYPAEQFLTSEGKILNVDFFVKWRVTDVGSYYLATNGDEEAAAGAPRRNREGRPQGRHRQAHDPAGRRCRARRVHRRHPRSSPAARWLSSASRWSTCASSASTCRRKSPSPSTTACGRTSRAQASQLRAEGDEQAQRIRAEAERERTELLAVGNRDAGSHPRRGRCAGRRHLRARLQALSRVLLASPQPAGVPQLASASRTTCWSSRPRASSSST